MQSIACIKYYIVHSAFEGIPATSIIKYFKLNYKFDFFLYNKILLFNIFGSNI